MKRTLCLIFITACILSFVACAYTGNALSTHSEALISGTYQKITAEEAWAMMQTSHVTIVDVRTAEEYAEEHILNAILLPNESIGTQPPETLPDLDAVLLVYCRTGVRSRQAANKLIQMGYRHVYDFGGITSWPYKTVQDTEK